ncbi:hypothetical protein K474DRAFT_1598918 [Panus rudis PR-1116 ss-1]|nr:hypothetical protein K474DRAFT_1598918 [Panus rudis PR-1116 ss-1]
MSVDLSAFEHARWERYCQLAATVFLGYEYLLQFSAEIDLFWRKRWSLGKCVFLWSRYYSLGFNIGFYSSSAIFCSSNANRCPGNRFFHWQNTGASLQVVTTHIILELRIYAMYGNSRYILALCCFLTLCEATVMGVIFGTPKPGLVGTNNPAPGLFICADSDPPGEHWITYYWTSILCIEGILLSLSVYKGYQNYRTGHGGSLMKELTRHSVFYFIVIFWIYLLNQILWVVNVLTLDELGTGFSFTVSAVLANRLMIAVRERYYYGREGGDGDESVLPTLQFNSNPKLKRTGQSTMTESTAVTSMASGSGTAGLWSVGETSVFSATTAQEENQPQCFEMDDFDDKKGF